MAFNRNTYHFNKYRKQAWADLAHAREIKVRAAADKAYDWEIPRIRLYAESALSLMRVALTYRRIRDMKRQAR